MLRKLVAVGACAIAGVSAAVTPPTKTPSSSGGVVRDTPAMPEQNQVAPKLEERTDGADPADDDVLCFADDDTVYNQESCEPADLQACSVYCDQSYFCTHFCGDACDEGTGAVCAMQALSNIQELCLTASLKVPSNWTGGKPVMSDNSAPDANAVGCDSHAYCTYCKDDKWCKAMLTTVASEILEPTAYQEIVGAGWGPLAMIMIGEISQICRNYVDDDGVSMLQDIVRLPGQEQHQMEGDDPNPEAKSGPEAVDISYTQFVEVALGVLAVYGVVLLAYKHREARRNYRGYRPIDTTDKSMAI